MRKLCNCKLADSEDILHNYSAIPLQASKGISLALEVGDLLGGTLGQLFYGIGGKEVDVMSKELNIADTLAALPSKLLNKGGPAFILKMLDGVKRSRNHDGKEVWEEVSSLEDFDNIYGGNYKELLAAVWWVIQINYGPFSVMKSEDSPKP